MKGMGHLLSKYMDVRHLSPSSAVVPKEPITGVMDNTDNFLCNFSLLFLIGLVVGVLTIVNQRSETSITLMISKSFSSSKQYIVSARNTNTCQRGNCGIYRLAFLLFLFLSTNCRVVVGKEEDNDWDGTKRRYVVG
jgi:hypothetical protein